MSSQCSYNLSVIIILLYIMLHCNVTENVLAEGKKCGHDLTVALASICENRFNTRLRRFLEQQMDDLKTSATDESWYYHLKETIRKMETDESNKGSYKADQAKANQKRILKRKRKQAYLVNSKGVADECCLQPCLYADILKYCA